MRTYIQFIIIFLLYAINFTAQAESSQTTRIPQFANDEVTVWKTIIYPNKGNKLPMHRYDSNRVLVALDNGTLKVTNNKGKVHYLKLEKNKAYYLAKDPKNEFHSDENITDHPIKCIVIELKK